jgi:hypothetical protein
MDKPRPCFEKPSTLEMVLKRLDEERKFFKQFNLKDEAKVRKIILEGNKVYNQIFGVPDGKQ